MHMKRLVVGAVAVTAALAMAGCSSSNSSSGASSSSGPVTLEMSWWGDSSRATLFDQVIKNFEAKYPNITVKETPVGATTDLFSRLDTDFAAGGTTAPDVFALGGSYPQSYGASGNLLSMSDPKIASIVQLSKYPQVGLTNGTVNNTVYALPTGGNATAMYVNTDILKEAGVTPPTGQWTWNDLINVANQVGKAGLKTSSGAPIMGVDLRIQDILGTYCGQLTQYGMYTPDGNLGVDAGNISSWFQIEQKLQQGGGIPDASVVTANWNLPTDQQPYSLGQAAITFGYSNLMTTYDKGGTTEIMNPPTDTGKTGVSLLPSAFWAINAKTAHPTEAAELVNWFLNEPSSAQLILDTRGVPFNPDVASIVAQNVQGDAQKADAYVGDVLQTGLVAPPQPNGGGNMNQYSQDDESNVLFGKMTPDQAAQDWISRVGADLAAAK